MLSILGRFFGFCVLNTASPVNHKRKYWSAYAALLLMINPVSAQALIMFTGTVPGSNLSNGTAFAGSSSPNFAELVVTGGQVRFSESLSSTVLFNQEWLARVSFNAIVRPVTDELEVTVELTHKVDPHPADGDAGGGPTYSVTYSCTAGGVCAGHANSGALFDNYKQSLPEAVLNHNGPGDHRDIFDSAFSVDVSKADFCLPACGNVGWQIDSWRLDLTGMHVPEPSSLALLVAGVVALSLGRGRGLTRVVPQVSATTRRRRNRSAAPLLM